MAATPTSPESDLQDSDPDLRAARKALALEATALQQLADNLGDCFKAALDLMEQANGRVVVTGMGKSGHVGNKIAATLASTGTPAFFIHPGEASHGDLGMITRDDVVLALSNSGNTAELGDIIAYTRRFAIPLIGITSRKDSLLGRAANITLRLPPVAEACPLGLAPTTSTTATIALGDALAVALLDRHHFTSQDFQVFHPGGSLGNKLQTVGDLMHQADEIPLCTRDTPMQEAILTMTAKHFGCVGIVDEAGRLAGIITDGDLRRNMGGSLLEQTAGETMTISPHTTQTEILAAEALGVMNRGEHPFTALFVVDDDHKPVGIIHIHDLLRAGIA